IGKAHLAHRRLGSGGQAYFSTFENLFGDSLDADTRPIGDADNAGINDRAGHQHEHGIADYLQSFLHGCIPSRKCSWKVLGKALCRLGIINDTKRCIFECGGSSCENE
ncbi:hypothetical protein, partial [Pseudomonas lundensis]